MSPFLETKILLVEYYHVQSVIEKHGGRLYTWNFTIRMFTCILTLPEGIHTRQANCSQQLKLILLSAECLQKYHKIINN